ncbi:hypothetical protein [Pseudoxanthomonas japonensis]|uniref:hypothetical protein n=1 Tax=Pseudoxanthomonas japonensis TaxID=69284 RepID=UPI00374895DE
MKRGSPDAGRRRARRRDDGTGAEVAPLCAASVFAAATLAIATLGVPDTLRTMTDTVPKDAACHPAAMHLNDDDNARG